AGPAGVPVNVNVRVLIGMSGMPNIEIVRSVVLMGPVAENWYGGGNDIVTDPVIAMLSAPGLTDPVSVSIPALNAVEDSSGEIPDTVPTVQVAPWKQGASTLLIFTPVGLPSAIALVADSPAPCVTVTATSAPEVPCPFVTVAAIVGAYG